MKRWFISDTHFSHKNIIKYTNRPFKDIMEMNVVLIKNWNELVSEEDLIFFLGDFGIGSIESLEKINSQLNGNKICIKGNHDGTTKKMHRMGFSVVLEKAFIKIGRHLVELTHSPSKEKLNHFQLHGHVHDKQKAKIIDNKLNLSVEVWDYKPVLEKQILSLLDKNSD